MALFKSNPEKAVQRDIDAAIKNRERLSAQVVEFEQAITRHAAAAKQAALKGDDADLDRAEVSLRAAHDRSKTLKAALAHLEQELAALERTKAEIADGKLRAETAAKIELLVRNMTDVAAEFDAVAARLAEHTARAVPVLWEARGLDEFITIGRAQVPPAIELVGTMLRAYADDVIAGKAPATLPVPETPPKTPEATPAIQSLPPTTPEMTSDPVLVAANFQRLDRRTGRVVQS